MDLKLVEMIDQLKVAQNGTLARYYSMSTQASLDSMRIHAYYEVIVCAIIVVIIALLAVAACFVIGKRDDKEWSIPKQVYCLITAVVAAVVMFEIIIAGSTSMVQYKNPEAYVASVINTKINSYLKEIN